MAWQMINAFDRMASLRPNKICGIPDGATLLAKDIIKLMYLPESAEVKMEKVGGKITLLSGVEPGDKVLMIEDFCTRGTGFIEAVTELHAKQPAAKILPLELVMLNRGSLEEIYVEDVGAFAVVPIVRYPIQEWEAAICPLCRDYGSVAIKPKESEASWRDITTSQLPASKSAGESFNRARVEAILDEKPLAVGNATRLEDGMLKGICP